MAWASGEGGRDCAVAASGVRAGEAVGVWAASNLVRVEGTGSLSCVGSVVTVDGERVDAEVAVAISADSLGSIGLVAVWASYEVDVGLSVTVTHDGAWGYLASTGCMYRVGAVVLLAGD